MEKVKIPWLFGALILGVLLSFANPFWEITSSDTFDILSRLGMYFLLFIIGFEINIKGLLEKKGFIIKCLLIITLFTTIIDGFAIKLLFGTSLPMTVLIAFSFATVGAAILIPILDEFGLGKTDFGRTIIEIGTLDDLIEIIALITVIIFVGTNQTGQSTLGIILSLFLLLAMTIGLLRLNTEGRKFKTSTIENLFLFVVFILMLFLGVGELAHAGALAAMLAGLSLGTFVPEKRKRTIDDEVRAMSYGLFAPIFFLWVGLSVNMNYILGNTLVVILVFLITTGSKVFGSWFASRNELGRRRSMLLGVGLSLRFSTSMIILKILLENELINSELYSAIMGASIISIFVIPITFSLLLRSSSKDELKKKSLAKL